MTTTSSSVLITRVFAVMCSAVALCALVACGDVFADPEGVEQTDVDASGFTEFDSGIDSPFQGSTTSSSGGSFGGTCPALRPRENTGCPASGLACEFGTSADSQCNDTLACFGNSDFESYWDRRLVTNCHDNICPKQPGDTASIDGQPCSIPPGDGGVITDADEAVCNMTDGVCACTTGASGASAHDRKWVCVRPISVCPPHRPLLGAECPGDLWCDYGNCSFKRGVVMECLGDGSGSGPNHWATAGAACP